MLEVPYGQVSDNKQCPVLCAYMSTTDVRYFSRDNVRVQRGIGLAR